MADYPSFDQAKVDAAMAAIKAHASADGLNASADDGFAHAAAGEFSVFAGCVTVTIDNGQVCLRLPDPFGSICIPIPGGFSGQAQACLDICSTFGIPHGVKITISINGQVIVTKVVGIC